MKIPPTHLDNAKVLQWAWSGKEPFGQLTDENGQNAIKIYGFAICQYEDSKEIYRFSCTKKWEVVQDMDYDSVEEAKNGLPKQYQTADIVWQIMK